MTGWCMRYCDGVSPVGVDMAQTCLSVLAGVSRFQDHDSAVEIPPESPSFSAEPLVVSTIPWLGADLTGPQRLERLVNGLITAWIENETQTRRSLARVGLFWALPQVDDATVSWGFDGTAIESQWAAFGLPKPLTIQTSDCGRCGMFTLLQRAIGWAEDQQDALIVLGGADSYIDTSRLALLDQSNRLKTSRNRDGFIPGEGASLCVFQRAPTANTLRIDALGLGQEERDFGSDKLSTAKGLTTAINQVTQENVDSLRHVTADLNGESYFFQEWGLAQLRALNDLAIDIQHPADCLGDLGAASGGVLLALAHQLSRERAGPGLVWSSCDGPERVAIRVSPQS